VLISIPVFKTVESAIKILQSGVAAGMIGSKASDTNLYISNTYATDTDFGVGGKSITLTTAGNVGIGTTNPTTALDVSGSINASINITSSGKVISSGLGFYGSWSPTYLQGIWSIGSGYAPVVADNYGNMYGIGYDAGINGGTTGAKFQSHEITFIGNGTVYGAISLMGQGYLAHSLGIGDLPTSPVKLYVSGGWIGSTTLAGTGTRALYSTSIGTITNTASDRRLKKNVEPISYGLAEVLKMKPIFYQWLDEKTMGGQKEVGFIAQDVRALIPEVVGTNSDKMLSLDYPKLTAVLAKSIQELNAKVDTLEQKAEIQQKQIDALKKAVEGLKK